MSVSCVIAWSFSFIGSRLTSWMFICSRTPKPLIDRVNSVEEAYRSTMNRGGRKRAIHSETSVDRGGIGKLVNGSFQKACFILGLEVLRLVDKFSMD